MMRAKELYHLKLNRFFQIINSGEKKKN